MKKSKTVVQNLKPEIQYDVVREGPLRYTVFLVEPTVSDPHIWYYTRVRTFVREIKALECAEGLNSGAWIELGPIRGSFRHQTSEETSD